MASKRIFIAFGGPQIDQAEPVHRIADEFECWNLRRFQLDGFIESIKRRIPPVNDNVLDNYKGAANATTSAFGTTEAEYTATSWGLLLPDVAPGAIVNGYAEALFLLNLFSPYFLLPAFFVTELGIGRPQQQGEFVLYSAEQNQAQLFRRETFVQFYNALISESVYGAWQADRMAKWNREDWRLFTASLLFKELRTYQGGKEIFTWQRESAGMATILEALFTAVAGGKEYKLKKRAAALLAFRLPDIEKDIAELYEQRSFFVHGSFFVKLCKDIDVEAGLAKLPAPPFEFLYRQKENIRHALVAYLYLSRAHRSNPDEFGGCKRVIDILERSIIDTELRAKARLHVEPILSLLPASEV